MLDCLADAMSPAAQPPTQGSAAAAPAAVTDLWSVRAAALGFAQFWWFRSLFAISPAQAARLRLLVQERLADSKVRRASACLLAPVGGKSRLLAQAGRCGKGSCGALLYSPS